MNPAAKLILFLLALPILIGVFIVIIPLLLLLLFLSLFIPSIRFFHIMGSAPRKSSHPDDVSSEPVEGEVLEAEYTVVDSTEAAGDAETGSDRPQLKN
ncbi:MAG: hypothetical protein IKO93_08830 [Lentisphaeria bacterium]|nr:hypothetical protein [Lentisphaeria bacterium]